jgi:hypothetical protein
MIRYKLIHILAFALLSNWCLAQYVSDNERLKSILDDKGQVEIAIRYPGSRALSRITRNVSVTNVKNSEVRIKLSQSDAGWFLDERISFRIIEQSGTKGIINSASVKQAMNWESYPSYTQYDSIMRSFQAGYPSICRLDTIGTSINGRLFLARKISDNCGMDEPETEVFYTSTIHGDETGGFIMMLRLADYLLKNYQSDPRIRGLVDNLEIWINPLSNPDGTYRNGNFINSPVRFNANGYDLNRNFPDPENPLVIQQKEALDMMRFLSERRFSLSVNFHSGEEVVNYPWDRWPAYHADNGWFYAISRAWADTVHLHARKGYMDFLDNGVTNGYSWYPVYGSRQDYVTYELSGREITVELDSNFITPAEDLPDLWEFNYRSMINFIEGALFGIHGRITDAYSGDPVPARIFIQGHDKDNSHVYSDTSSGYFTRLLAPGVYNLIVTAGGYSDLLVKDVSVYEGEATDLDLKMRPILNRADTIYREHPFIYPNPADDFIKVVVPEHLKGLLNISIFNLSGRHSGEYTVETVDRYPIMLETAGLGSGSYYILIRNLESGEKGYGNFVIVR